MKTDITFDSLNIYILSKVPTNTFLKVMLFIFNCGAIIGLFWLAISVQGNKPNFFPFLIPIGYFLTMGRYLFWNIFGEEIYIISTTHISHQHNYGFWRSKFKTSNYNEISINNNEIKIMPDEPIKLTFRKYNEEKLPLEIFKTSLPIKYSDSERIFNRLNEIKINEFGEEINFPKIFSN